jgi:translocation and assembly module TamA
MLGYRICQLQRLAAIAHKTLNNLLLGLTCAAATALLNPGASAQQAASATTATKPSPAAAFDIEVQAPEEVQAFLLRHIDLQHYRDMHDLDGSELSRLVAASYGNIQDLLGTLGYFAPVVQVTTKATPDNPKAQRQITITVDPGEPIKITEVVFEFAGHIADGAAALAYRTAIEDAWSLRRGMAFSQSKWDAAKTQALRLLTEKRYPAGELVDSQAEIDPVEKTAVLRVRLDSGPLYRVGPLQPSGLQRFDTALVAKYARLPPGGVYQQTDLLEAQQRLVDSGLFDSVFVSIDTAGDPANAPVLVQVKEASLQKIVLGVGASTDSGLRLSAEHSHHKVPGIDWKSTAKLSLDRDTQLFDGELTSPPDDTGTRWVTSALLQSQLSGSFEVDSLRYRVGRAQTQGNTDRNYYLQYDHSTKYGAGSAVAANALTVNYAWTQRNFDSLPFPQRGYGLAAELGGGYTLTNNRLPYVRAVVRWLGVWPVAGAAAAATSSPTGRIATRAEVGAVIARDDAEIPSNQLFLTGGDTTVRGYTFRSIGSDVGNNLVSAGRYLTVGSMEWQRPILLNGRPSDWESTVFVDAGAVADQRDQLNAKVGVGVGARWRSPVGPLQIDLAYGLAVKELRLHLSVGFNF